MIGDLMIVMIAGLAIVVHMDQPWRCSIGIGRGVGHANGERIENKDVFFMSTSGMRGKVGKDP